MPQLDGIEEETKQVVDVAAASTGVLTLGVGRKNRASLRKIIGRGRRIDCLC